MKIILSNQVSNELYKLEYRFAIAPQSYTWYRLTFRRIFDNDNKLTKVVGKVVDISSELRLKHQSITDPLTEHITVYILLARFKNIVIS
ncbi:MAG: hypothetical protein ACLRQF_02300 [Thomasclavelia ramosa]